MLAAGIKHSFKSSRTLPASLRFLHCRYPIPPRHHPAPALSAFGHRPSPHILSNLSKLARCTATTVTTFNTVPPPVTTPSDVYRPPTNGFISRLPSSWIPYAELIRLDKPAGTIYLFLPCLWSTLIASTMTLSPLSSVLSTTALFATGAVVMRGAGCTVNDLWDRNIDPLVSRTKFRPLARGALMPKQALTFLTVQLSAGAAVLFSFPVECIYWGIPSLLLVGTYPLFKRITHYPQFVLGLAYSWGALLGFPAMGLTLGDPGVLATAACLYASNVAWTVLYDTIYAHQDVSDDVKAGVKSIAVKHENDTKKIMAGLGLLQVSFLAAAGGMAGFGPVFFAESCGGAALGLGWMISRAKLKVVSDCWYWFKWCAVVVGGMMVGGGLFGEYMVTLYRAEGRAKKEGEKIPTQIEA